MLVYSFLLILVAIGDLTLLISVIRIIIAQCDAGSDYYNEYAARECSYRVWFAGKGSSHSNKQPIGSFLAVFLPVQLLMVTAAAIVCILLYYNFKFEAGQLVEGCLVQTRDVSKVLQSVVHGKYVLLDMLNDYNDLVVHGNGIMLHLSWSIYQLLMTTTNSVLLRRAGVYSYCSYSIMCWLQSTGNVDITEQWRYQ